MTGNSAPDLRRRADDPARRRRTAHDHRQALELRTIALLHRREKRVHVAMENDPRHAAAFRGNRRPDSRLGVAGVKLET